VVRALGSRLRRYRLAVILGLRRRALRPLGQCLSTAIAPKQTWFVRLEHDPDRWDRLAEICGQFLSKVQLVDIEGRLQTRQWDDDAGKRHWKTEVVVASLEMLSGRSKKEYAKEAQAAAGGTRTRPLSSPPATAPRTSRWRPSSRCEVRAAGLFRGPVAQSALGQAPTSAVRSLSSISHAWSRV